MIQDVLVGLALPMLHQVVVLWIWRKVIAGFEMGEIALDVARGTRASWSCETDVGRHDEVLILESTKGRSVFGCFAVERSFKMSRFPRFEAFVWRETLAGLALS